MSLSQASSFNELVTNILIEELYRNKIDTFFISPGSRSTHLTSSVASHKRLTSYVHYDERGSAFQALGYARATRKPGVLICTSGSAGANYFPAICEASADSVPMIILTADRPPELHNVLANQTCNQQNMFGGKVKEFFNIEPPDKNISLQEVLERFSLIIQRATMNPSGPVHINCMYREPFVVRKSNKDYSKYRSEIKNWIRSDKPYQKIKSQKILKSISLAFDKSLPTILIAGDLKSKKEIKAVQGFAEKDNLPIFADIRSGMRLSNKCKNVISFYDQLLLTDKLPKKDTYQVIHVGGNIVSKRLLQFIEKAKIKEYLVLHNSIDAYNAHHKLTECHSGPIDKLLKQLATMIKPFDNKFIKDISNHNEKIRKSLNQHNYEFSEISITRTLTQEIKNNTFICSANSLAIRLLDMFADTSHKNIELHANRGLSGIDGTIATAVGIAIGLNKSGTLLIGDLAFQHDINSLALAKESPNPIVIVLLNNNGGKIFSHLPISKDKDIYIEYFETPQNLIFKPTAEQYDLPYYFISSTRQFKEVYLKAQMLNKSSIIEISLEDSDILKAQKKVEKELKLMD